jgi:protein-S-isoprenylcysteine O-methyltransferase Ste14
MTSPDDRGRQRKRINRGRLIVFLLAVPVYFGLFMFLPAGAWAWAKGWGFLGVLLGTVVVVDRYLWRVNPEVVVARSSFHEGTKRWDKILMLSFIFPSFFAIVPVAALDSGRFQWSAVPGWVCGLGYVLFLAGMGLTAWAEAANKFFEVTVRIQTDRGHKVIDTGPYAIVRHPGYVAGVLWCMGPPLCLGSLWALIPAGLTSALLVLRTQWENQMLQAELAGYKEYAERVRFRLIPGVW